MNAREHIEPEPAPDTLTWSVPAGRAASSDLQAVMAHVAQSALVTAMLRSIDGIAMVLNEYRQIVAVNETLLEFLNCRDATAALGMRPGEAAQCIHADANPDGGCGTSSFCASCGALIAIITSEQTGFPQESTCTLTTKTDEGEATADFVVRAGTFALGEHNLTFVSFHAPGRLGDRGTSHFHTLLATAGALAGATQCTIDSNDPTIFDHSILGLAERLELELMEQDDMADLTSGRVLPRTRMVTADEISKALVHTAAQAAAQKKILDIEPFSPYAYLESDPALLLRTLQNAIARSLEGTAEEGTVRVWCEAEPEHIAFHISRATIMDPEAAVGVYERYFAASMQHGWELGTRGRTLMVEEYLGGRVIITVTPWDGTSVAFQFPRNPQ